MSIIKIVEFNREFFTKSILFLKEIEYNFLNIVRKRGRERH